MGLVGDSGRGFESGWVHPLPLLQRCPCSGGHSEDRSLRQGTCL